MTAPDRIVAYDHGHWEAVAGKCQVAGSSPEYIRCDPAPLASLPEVQAMIGAVVDHLANMILIHAGGRTEREMADLVRALHPDALTALEAYWQRVWEEAREDAAKACDRRAGNASDFDRYTRRAAGMCAADIRAMKGPKP